MDRPKFQICRHPDCPIVKDMPTVVMKESEWIAALLDALEELTGIKGLGANNPMESRLAIAALSDYIRHSKPKEAEQ